MKLKLLIFLLGAGLLNNVQAQGIEISCDSSPSEAVLEVPAPANKLVHVICSKYGHIINPVKDWFWTRPGGFSPVFFPSQMVKSKPKELNNNSYFKNISVKELNNSEAEEKWKIFEGVFDESEKKELKGLEIAAENYEGKKHTIYVFDNNWGYGCSPSCNKENGFLLMNQEKKNVSW